MAVGTKEKAYSLSVGASPDEPVWNIAPIFYRGVDSTELWKITESVRAGFKHADFDKSRFMGDLPYRSDMGAQRIYPVTTDFEGLPQIVAIETLNPSEDVIGRMQRSVLYIPTEEPSKEGWHLATVIEDAKKDDGNPTTRLANWMEHRPDGENSIFYFRYRILPEIGKGLIQDAKKWTGSFQYRASKGESDDRTQEWGRIDVNFGRDEEGNLELATYDAKARFEIWPFCYGKPADDQKKVFTLNDQSNSGQLKAENERHASFGLTREQMSRLTLGSHSTGGRDVGWSEIMTVMAFPNYSIEKDRVDVRATLNKLIDAFRSGEPSDLAGFSAIEFK